MKTIRHKVTGKTMSCTDASWEAIGRYGKQELFDVISEQEIKPIATKRTVAEAKVEEVVVPEMPTLPEHEEVKAKQRGRKKQSEKSE